MKYVILNNNVIKYEYSSEEECTNNGEGEANENKYECGKCEDNVKTICEGGNTPGEDTNDDSTSSMFISILSIITLFFF
ncbi:hypothetical protein ENUP19_0102G0048 [Entamoeba nuttalli]|uniref:Uncharacterized protein n=1 Tax=Entamoeba nuttalli TaxID=412467 RepID=A0ABQ0DI02_9EUKA